MSLESLPSMNCLAVIQVLYGGGGGGGRGVEQLFVH